MTQPPSNPGLELIAAVTKGAASSIPVVGGVAAEVANLFLNPLERRKQRWMEEVGRALAVIETRFSLLPSQLEQDERFASALLQATLVAHKTHQASKLRVLRHALISSASPDRPSDDLCSQFMRYVDELAPTHIRILSILLQNHEAVSQLSGHEEVHLLVQQHLAEPLDRAALRVFVQDLDARFLLRVGDIEELPEYRSRQSLMAREDSATRPLEVTPLGRSFLVFIEEV